MATPNPLSHIALSTFLCYTVFVMSQSLVLNASFEPLAMVPQRRALVLVLEGKAELVEKDSKIIRSVAAAFNLPKVIRLLRYVKVGFRKGPRRPTLQGLILRDGAPCAYCQVRTATSVDHIIPRAQGGAHTWMNTCAACDRCNNRKGDRTPAQANMRLQVTPKEPRVAAWFMVAAPRTEPSWEPYLKPFTDTMFVSLAAS